MMKQFWPSTMLLWLLFFILVPACLPAAQPDELGGSPTNAASESEALLPNQDPTHVPEHTSSPERLEMEAPCDDPFAGSSVRFNLQYWSKTDFCIHSVPYDQFLSGGPPPDGIPAIDAPVFESVTAADQWLGDRWPVMFFEHAGDARAYPLAILMWHEIVNDVVGEKPVSLTFCPLCNATIAFDRTLSDGSVLDFGTSGNLRNSDLVMYDRQTQSWWQQFTGEALVGDYTGLKLVILPSQIVAWGDFAEQYPDGKVLSRETGHNRDYGRNPYAGYDDVNTSPFLFDGDLDGRLPATSRVAAVEVDGIWVAYPFSALQDAGVVNDVVGEVPLVVFWKPGTVSALDRASYDDARDVGSTSVFSRHLGGQVLTFRPAAEGFMDFETRSVWNIFGKAVAGPLEGEVLPPIVSAEHFWFSWAAFRPETLIWGP